ncbi:hypothetical protein ES708_25859 [subsurface metagenome]
MPPASGTCYSETTEGHATAIGYGDNISISTIGINDSILGISRNRLYNQVVRSDIDGLIVSPRRHIDSVAISSGINGILDSRILV